MTPCMGKVNENKQSFASELGFYAHRGPGIARAPASALAGTQKFPDLTIKHGRLFEVDGMAGSGLDDQPGGGNGAFRDEVGRDAGVVLIAANNKSGDQQCRKPCCISMQT